MHGPVASPVDCRIVTSPTVKLRDGPQGFSFSSPHSGFVSIRRLPKNCSRETRRTGLQRLPTSARRPLPLCKAAWRTWNLCRNLGVRRRATIQRSDGHGEQSFAIGRGAGPCRKPDNSYRTRLGAWRRRRWCWPVERRAFWPYRSLQPSVPEKSLPEKSGRAWGLGMGMAL